MLLNAFLGNYTREDYGVLPNNGSRLLISARTSVENPK